MDNRERSANLRQDRCCEAEPLVRAIGRKAEKAIRDDEAKSEDLPVKKTIRFFGLRNDASLLHGRQRPGVAVLVCCVKDASELERSASFYCAIEGQGRSDMKQAIIVVSFGTTHEDAAQSAIVPVESAIARAFPDWDIRRAWTARGIAKKLAERGTPVENEAEALARLRREGYERIVLASTHIIPGREYGMVKAAAGGCPVSAPLLDSEEDLRWMAALLGKIADGEGRTLLVMGHGTEHAADETYARLRSLLPGNVMLACVEGRYGLEGILPDLEGLREKKLTLMPLMLVAGDHAKNDLAGDGADSWKRRLEGRGFDIRVRLQGLGAMAAVRERFAQKVAGACHTEG